MRLGKNQLTLLRAVGITAPVRLRLSRAKGFDLQRHSLETNGLLAINVARPGPLGNPFVVGIDGDREHCVDLHRKMLAGYDCLSSKARIAAQQQAREYAIANMPRLLGHNIACWCDLDGPCHGNTLLEMAAKCEEIKP